MAYLSKTLLILLLSIKYGAFNFHKVLLFVIYYRKVRIMQYSI